MMKGFVISGVMTILICFNTMSVKAQQYEIEQLLLNVEKLSQFKQILEDMQKGYKVVSTGYNTIKDLSEGNFSLHKTFLDGLLEVSPTVKNYKRIAEIITMQRGLVREYKSAFNRFNASGSFTPGELNYMFHVYERLLDNIKNDLESLLMIVTAGKLRMSDDERLKAIDDLFLSLQEKVSFLRNFNNSSTLLSLARLKERRNLNAIQELYGLISP
ncbi:TerB family tellurite resistance protein [Solitalea lacus]|uniref:TerB family tellurite resistance protein n=1 Tax=Solitalea lacus TaxID=2911172 RepID=UPI001EDA7876|nr:TerB family tellurite resistance protein [Solitalea lacus]UKJ09227.1 TerB family tellurite resistance protein [Solitalea lacus]